MKRYQRVQLRVNDQVRGTVTKLFKDGAFRITYDGTFDDKGFKIPGGKYEYAAYQAESFIIL